MNILIMMTGHILTSFYLRLSKPMPFFKNMERFRKLLSTKNVEILGLVCLFLKEKCPFIIHSKTRPKLVGYALDKQ